jgi:hypothetical protein
VWCAKSYSSDFNKYCLLEQNTRNQISIWGPNGEVSSVGGGEGVVWRGERGVGERGVWCAKAYRSDCNEYFLLEQNARNQITISGPNGEVSRLG